MYLFTKCQYPGCKKTPISGVSENGELMESSGYCLEHQKDRIETLEKLKRYIDNHDKIVGLNASYITIKDTDFSRKKFYGCNFQHCKLIGVYAKDFRAKMCMFDFCTVTESKLEKCYIQFSSFSGTKFVHALFSDCDLIHNNFNGITAYQSSFDDSNMYNTRFIKAILINTSIKNCNLKKTVFYSSVREGVSFKMSNTRNALIDRRQGGLMGDFSARYDIEDNSEISL